MLYKAIPPKAPHLDHFVVQVINTDYAALSSPNITVPTYYYEHLKRFLWRHRLFIGVNERAQQLPLAMGLRPLIQQYIMYMDAIVEALLTTARKASEHQEGWRAELFDLYLVVEHMVERHEYHLGDDWRLKNPDHILEQINVNSLRMFQFIIIYI